MKHKRHLLKRPVSAILAVALLCTHLWACAWQFPNRILIDSDNTLLKAPVSDFFAELKNIPLEGADRYRAILSKQPAEDKVRRTRGSASNRTLDQDLADLRRALADSNVSTEQIDPIARDYRQHREAVMFFKAKLRSWAKMSFKGPQDFNEPKPTLKADPIPRQVPKQFRLYAEGAYHYSLGQKDRARQLWKSVLDLPANERKYRSTWAAFMLAKSAPATEEACQWYDYIFELMNQGFYDSLGLGLTGIGDKGRIALNRKDYAQAIKLYLLQFHLGDPTAGPSLQATAGSVLSDQSTQQMLARIAADKTARRVITAYIASRGGPFAYVQKGQGDKWLQAAESAGLGIIADAGRLAMIAYQGGNMDIAERWTRFGTEDDFAAQWIAAKILLRKGNVNQAAERLAGVCRSFAPAVDPHPKYGSGNYLSRWNRPFVIDPAAKNARGELGILLLSQSQYAQALDVLLAGGLWTDAAYVAEYVLQPDELKHYADSVWPEINSQDTDTRKTASEWIRTNIRYLLARRLTRIGRWKEARSYYPQHLRERLDIYVNAIRAGHDESLSAADRAANLWKAARIARHEGLQLLATEAEPDWFAFSGNFQRPAVSKIRLKSDKAKIAPASNDERDRISRHRAEPDKRWHYRHTAAGHAWRAAELMPDESDETAKVLCIAGSWLKREDPDAADRFYKALVRRCGKTRIGKEADKLRWFPKISEERYQPLK